MSDKQKQATDIHQNACHSSGGTIYTVIDGHGGHACAHGINLMHSDYLISGLLSPEACEEACNFIKNIQEAQSAHSICKLAKTLWSDPEAILSKPTKRIEFVSGMDYSKSDFLQNQCSTKWAAWGPWGPLPSSVWDVHTKNLRKFLEELLSTSFEYGKKNFEIKYQFKSYLSNCIILVCLNADLIKKKFCFIYFKFYILGCIQIVRYYIT